MAEYSQKPVLNFDIGDAVLPGCAVRGVLYTCTLQHGFVNPVSHTKVTTETEGTGQRRRECLEGTAAACRVPWLPLVDSYLLG